MTVTVAVAQNALQNIDQLIARLSGSVRFVTGPVETPEQIGDLTADADALVVGFHRLDRPRIDALGESVQVIGRTGVGLDSIDLPAAERRGVAVVYQPTYATAEVATHAVSMLLALQRRLPQADGVLRTGGWGTILDVGRVQALDEASVAVLGCGRIGRAVVERLRPFVREVRVFDPVLVDGVPGARTTGSVDELLDGADALSLHVPLNDDTRHMIGAAELGRMRPGALVVNVSRGGLIDEDALAAALVDGRIAGAGLDVFEQEPLPADSQLRSAPNLLASPHVAWYSDSALRRLSEWTIADVVAFAERREVDHGQLAVAPAGPAVARV